MLPDTPDLRLSKRMRVLRSFGASDSAAQELLAYNENRFRSALPPGTGTGLPLADEPFVEAWQGYAREAAARGVFPMLRDKLVQLRFPIRAGIGNEERYLAAAEYGELPAITGQGLMLELDRPELLELHLHPTPAGAIPIIVCRERGDFVKLVQALSMRNEPKSVPAAQGACIVTGYANWDRIRQYRAKWEGANGMTASEAEWRDHFRTQVLPNPALYRDRFILLTDGPYSAVPAADIGFSDREWRELSLAIRREHECAHYFTCRVYGSMRNRMLDELIADYAGIRAACGRYRADWFLRFVGLEDELAYRPGGRMEHYLGDPPIGEEAFRVLQRIVRKAARNLETFDRSLGHAISVYAVIGALTCFTLEELASDEAADRLRDHLWSQCPF